MRSGKIPFLLKALYVTIRRLLSASYSPLHLPPWYLHPNVPSTTDIKYGLTLAPLSVIPMHSLNSLNWVSTLLLIFSFLSDNGGLTLILKPHAEVIDSSRLFKLPLSTFRGEIMVDAPRTLAHEMRAGIMKIINLVKRINRVDEIIH